MAEVSVEVCAVRLLEAGAEAEVGQLDVASGVQKQIVRFYVSAKKLSFARDQKFKVWRISLADIAMGG